MAVGLLLKALQVRRRKAAARVLCPSCGALHVALHVACRSSARTPDTPPCLPHLFARACKAAGA